MLFTPTTPRILYIIIYIYIYKTIIKFCSLYCHHPPAGFPTFCRFLNCFASFVSHLGDYDVWSHCATEILCLIIYFLLVTLDIHASICGFYFVSYSTSDAMPISVYPRDDFAILGLSQYVTHMRTQ